MHTKLAGFQSKLIKSFQNKKLLPYKKKQLLLFYALCKKGLAFMSLHSIYELRQHLKNVTHNAVIC